MGWLEILNTVATSAAAVAQGAQVNKWLSGDLQTALQEIEHITSNYPAEVIDSYEEIMLTASLYIIDPSQRINLLKMYAFLKIAETNRFGFRGFANVNV